MPSLWESISEQLSDNLIKVLIGLGFLTILTGEAEDVYWGWTKGVSILLAISFLILVAAGNDYIKDKQFLLL
jgi:hypothetical protein